MQPKGKITTILKLAWEKRREGLYDTAYDLVKEAEGRCGEDDYAALGRIHHLYRQFEADQGIYTRIVVLQLV